MRMTSTYLPGSSLIMFAGAKNVSIYGGSFTVNNHHNCSQASRGLERSVAHSALYNSSARFDAPKCHPNTRLAVLDRLLRWSVAQEHPEAAVMWLYGAAGAGKSAILQSFAEHCAEMNLVLATFFLSRSDSTRNHAGPLIPTLAYQISCTIPEVKPAMDDIIAQDPLIFSKSLEAQAHALIVQPLWPLVVSGYFSNPTAPRLIIIDALDECKNVAMQSKVLTAISNLLLRYQMPLRLLISSRPEQEITFAFNSLQLLHIHTSISLNDELDSDSDIRLFLEDSFEEIRRAHPRRRLIPKGWPPASAIKTLVRKASGQFIYASTSITFISSLKNQPPRCLDVILGLTPPPHQTLMPFAEIDALYTHILTSASPEAVSILTYCLLSKVREVASVEYFLRMQEGDAEMYLDDLRALLSVSEQPSHHHDHDNHEAYNSMEIRLLHASLGDFMIDQNRAGEFYVNPAYKHAEYATQFLEHILDSSPPFSPLGKEDPELLNIETVLLHLTLAAPTPELTDTLLKCTSIELLKFYKPTAHHLMRKLYQRDLCEFIDSIRTMVRDIIDTIIQRDIPDAEELYTHQLGAYYQALRERLDILKVPKAFILFPLALAGDERWLSSLRLSVFPEMLDLLPEISDEVKYPYSAKYRSVYPHPAMHYMKTFFEDPKLSQHHHMTPERYLGAAEFTLSVLCDHTRLKQRTAYNPHDKFLRKNRPWRWRRLHFRTRIMSVRKTAARQHLQHRPSVPTVFAARGFGVCAHSPSSCSAAEYAFPKLHAALETNIRRASVYKTLLGGLPYLLSRAPLGSSALDKFTTRTFCNTSLRYQQSAKRGRNALQLFTIGR
ncbi:hypothetical protein D9619_011068 [Psilocybe cf. subviscida]|uniref:Nephrocystin 3-like N-terminal domain-containing protein n=1 Tax=Psilocybe cf. subviscida TaxID=2480587 RepID=A0A8H5BAQ8_9AGAR|nr:hypothetical protein D9619_011068 [Psilocybe cf. subviscida]